MGEVIYLGNSRELQLEERVELAGKLLEFRAKQRANGAAKPIEELVARLAMRRFWRGFAIGWLVGGFVGVACGVFATWALR